MLAWLASIIGSPIVNGLIEGYKAKLDAANTPDRIAAELAAKAIEADIAARRIWNSNCGPAHALNRPTRNGSSPQRSSRRRNVMREHLQRSIPHGLNRSRVIASSIRTTVHILVASMDRPWSCAKDPCSACPL